MKKTLLALTFALGSLAAAPMAAQAGGVSVGISIGVPGIVWGGPVYYAPPPPPAYYYEPAPVVVVPQRVYVPGPGYYYGWRGRGHHDRYVAQRWDRHGGGHGWNHERRGR